MLKPIVFPFSHLGEGELKTLMSYFTSITHLSLGGDGEDAHLTPWIEQGRILPVFPDSALLADIENRTASYQAWADLHRGNEKNLKSLFKKDPYFVDDTQLPSIQSQIRQGVSAGGPDIGCDESGELNAALVFLKLARNRDLQEEKVQSDMASMEAKQRLLFSQLKGSPGDELKGTPSKGGQDLGALMPLERISAWATVSRHCGLFPSKEDLPLLVTTSSAVFNGVNALAERVINTLDIDSIKVHENECISNHKGQGSFVEYIEQMIANGFSMELPLPEAQDECRVMGRFQLGLFSGRDLERMFDQPGRPIVVCRVELK